MTQRDRELTTEHRIGKFLRKNGLILDCRDVEQMCVVWDRGPNSKVILSPEQIENSYGRERIPVDARRQKVRFKRFVPLVELRAIIDEKFGAQEWDETPNWQILGDY